MVVGFKFKSMIVLYLFTDIHINTQLLIVSILFPASSTFISLSYFPFIRIILFIVSHIIHFTILQYNYMLHPDQTSRQDFVTAHSSMATAIN